MTQTTQTYTVLSINNLRELLKRAKENSRKQYGKVKGTACYSFHGRTHEGFTNKAGEEQHQFLTASEEETRSEAVYKAYLAAQEVTE
jgi:hypothetical protein